MFWGLVTTPWTSNMSPETSAMSDAVPGTGARSPGGIGDPQGPGEQHLGEGDRCRGLIMGLSLDGPAVHGTDTESQCRGLSS